METEVLQGTVSAVIFQNYDNGYSVLRLACEDGQTVTVVGTIPLPHVGERLMVTGRWSSHQSYGKQFEAEFLERLMPQTAQEITAFFVRADHQRHRAPDGHQDRCPFWR